MCGLDAPGLKPEAIDDECVRMVQVISFVVRLVVEHRSGTQPRLGNKAIYRTRMALADGAELIVLAPGVKDFGEDEAIDRLIRKHGHFGTSATLKAVENDTELAANLSAAAHLIHGSSEGRFTITYRPADLSQREICDGVDLYTRD